MKRIRFLPRLIVLFSNYTERTRNNPQSGGSFVMSAPVAIIFDDDDDDDDDDDNNNIPIN